LIGIDTGLDFGLRVAISLAPERTIPIAKAQAELSSRPEAAKKNGIRPMQQAAGIKPPQRSNIFGAKTKTETKTYSLFNPSKAATL
jgi:hypothetical protein